MAKKQSAKQEKHITIPPPNFQTAAFAIRGTAPLVIHAFSEKARKLMHKKHEEGTKVAGKRRAKPPRDFQDDYEQAAYRCDGWYGINASSFRCGMISACRTVGFKMTIAKLTVFVEADGFTSDGIPLVRITKGKPHYHESYVRNETGVVDLRARPMWDAGWEANVRVRFDADQFTLEDVANLMMRVGTQGGVGEGRPDSKKSAGMGWGLFELVGQEEAA